MLSYIKTAFVTAVRAFLGEAKAIVSDDEVIAHDATITTAKAVSILCFVGAFLMTLAPMPFKKWAAALFSLGTTLWKQSEQDGS